MSDSSLLTRDTAASQKTGWPVYWVGFLAIFVLLQSIGLAISINRGAPPDEMAHISYVRDTIEGNTLLPDYANGRIIHSHRNNYLKHPPLYYSGLGLFSRATGTDPVRGYVALRILSACFVGAGFFFWLLAFRNFNLTLGAAIIGTLATCAIPMFAYVAGSINNDTLAYLGVALAFFGLSCFRLQPDSRDAIGFFCFTAGIVIAFLTKATVSAFLVFFLAILAVLRWKDLLASIRNPYYLGTAALITLICGGYYLYATYSFGQLFPRPSALYPEKPPANPVGIWDFGVRYAKAMWSRFPVIMSHAGIKPIPRTIYPIFYTMALLPLAGWLLARPRARSQGAHPFQIALGDAFVVALLITFLLNILVTYKAYLHTGLYAGWQPRYFLFAIPAIWFIFALIKPTPGTKAAILGVFAITACIAFWSSTPFVLAKQQAKSTKKRAVTSARLSGHIDDFKLAGGQLHVRGWAFDTAAGKTPQRVWVMLDKTRLDSVAVNDARPDVAKALGNNAADNAGFYLEVSGIPSTTEPCRITLKAELADGSLNTLKNPACWKLTPPR